MSIAASASAAVYRFRAMTQATASPTYRTSSTAIGGVRGDHDVRGDRPGARKAALLAGEVGAGERRDHAGDLPGGADVHRGDLRVRIRAAQESHVDHAGQGDVVGPVGLAGDEPGVL